MAVWWGYVQTAQVQVVQFEANFVPKDGLPTQPPSLLNGAPVPLAALIVTTKNGVTTLTVDVVKLLAILGPVQFALLWGG